VTQRGFGKCTVQPKNEPGKAGRYSVPRRELLGWCLSFGQDGGWQLTPLSILGFPVVTRPCRHRVEQGLELPINVSRLDTRLQRDGIEEKGSCRISEFGSDM
jgi:hypothetical protein